MFSLGEANKMEQQQQFERFMADQLTALAASGLDAETWVQRHAESFRAQWAARPAEEACHEQVRPA